MLRTHDQDKARVLLQEALVHQRAVGDRLGAARTTAYLGRIEAAKGFDTLLEACRSLPRAGWSLSVAGRAVDGLDRYRARAEGLPATFLGYAERDAFLDGIDCLVVPPIGYARHHRRCPYQTDARRRCCGSTSGKGG